MQRTQTSTLITQPTGKTENLFSANFWCRVKVYLETAGPVAVGLGENLSPVLSGKGILLPSGGPELEFELQKGDRLYYIATAINRVKVIVVPEFLQEATEIIDRTTMGIVPGIATAISAAFYGLVGRKAPQEPQKPVCPPPLKLPRY